MRRLAKAIQDAGLETDPKRAAQLAAATARAAFSAGPAPADPDGRLRRASEAILAALSPPVTKPVQRHLELGYLHVPLDGLVSALAAGERSLGGESHSNPAQSVGFLRAMDQKKGPDAATAQRSPQDAPGRTKAQESTAPAPGAKQQLNQPLGED